MLSKNSLFKKLEKKRQNKFFKVMNKKRKEINNKMNFLITQKNVCLDKF